MQLDRLDITQNPTFKRFFVCFEAMRKGFVEACRPFIGLDGCHLKGNFGGVLLVAVSLEGNNGLFPVAYGVLECECKDSWGWFPTCLETIIGQSSSRVPYVIMSDKQKGLIEAILDVMLECQVRHCTRHLYNNFRGKHSGLALRDNFWRAVKAYNLFLFEKAIWVDNLRGKTILTLVEQVRLKIMEQLHEQYTSGWNWEIKVTLEAWKKIELTKKIHYSCPCGVWEISGLPCKHVAKCITYKRADIQDYCDPFYSMSIYIRAYSQILHSMPDIDMLPKGELETGQDTVLPPKRKKLIGRPKKKRKKEQGEHAPGLQEARRYAL
ncbi:uncharacterized protein LOC126696648 [Quercus robur]|uniref:uncharacterized protein LOC126696648 n=1 Tax=Quercus robur TaxID=38942 RepID=UPI00216350E8|nr:uncharacterized protein LOC126696648 [Quercus robur]